jgi:hypothetical protein
MHAGHRKDSIHPDIFAEARDDLARRVVSRNAAKANEVHIENPI